MNTNQDLFSKIKHLNPCLNQNEQDWLNSHPSFQEAWYNCDRGDWMLWLLGKMAGPPESASRKKLVLCACKCARLALFYVKNGEDRPRLAIETAEKYARGECVTLTKVIRAAYAADAAAYAANAAYAAYAAAYAADAAAYAAYAAYAAANAAAYAAAYAAAKNDVLVKCADIVRADYPNSPII